MGVTMYLMMEAPMFHAYVRGSRPVSLIIAASPLYKGPGGKLSQSLRVQLELAQAIKHSEWPRHTTLYNLGTRSRRAEYQ